MGTLEPARETLRDGRGVVVRAARAEDAGAVVAAAKRLFAQTDMVLTQADEFTISTEDEAKLLESRAASRTGLFLIAVEDCVRDAGGVGCGIVGIAGLDPSAKRRMAHCVTLGMMVDEAWRGVGVGDALMRALLGYARGNEHIRRVQLEVVASNTRAVALYRRYGFQEEGRRVACFQRQPGVFEDDLIMAVLVRDGAQ